MAQTITGIFQAKVITDLDTYNHTTLQAAMYMVKMEIQEVPPSGITIAIKLNGVTKASVSAPAAAQQNQQLQLVLNCALSDVIGVVVSSSTASDTGVNAFKGLLNIHVGSF